MNLMHWIYRKSHLCHQVTLVFTADDVMKLEKNDVTLCKLDIDVKNRTKVEYRKNSKIWDTSNNCHNCPKNRKV